MSCYYSNSPSNLSPMNSKQIDNNLYVFIDTFNTKLPHNILIPLLKLILKYDNKIYFYLTGIVFNKDHIKPFNDDWYQTIKSYFETDNILINCKYHDLYSNEKIESKIGAYIMRTVGFNSQNIGSMVLISGDADTKTRNIPLWKICETSLEWGWNLCVISWLKKINSIYNMMNERYKNMYLFNFETLLKEKEKYETRKLVSEWNKYMLLKSTECLEGNKSNTYKSIIFNDYYKKTPIEQAHDTAIDCIKEFI